MKRAKNQKVLVTLMLSAVCMMTSIMPVMAEEAEVKEFRMAIIENHELVMKEQSEFEEAYVEYTADPLSDYDDVEIMTSMLRSTGGISYTLGGGVLARTASFSKSSGTITISVGYSPTNVTIYGGIIEPDGVRRYIASSGSLNYSFNVAKSGTHCVYMQNPSSTAVQITGGYAY